jgi:hypothetical protein
MARGPLVPMKPTPSGGFHGFDQIAPDAAVSRQGGEARVGWLRRILAR